MRKSAGEDFGEKLLDLALSFAGKQGLILVRKRMIATANGVVRGIRYSLLLHYLILFFCFLSALSFFATFYILIQQIGEPSGLRFSWTLVLSGSLFTMCALLLYLTVREKTWLAAFQVEEVVDGILGTQASTPGSSIDPDTLTQIIDEALDRRFEKLAEQLRKNN